MGQRTSERLSAGKRAAKYLACRVCEERVFTLFPASEDQEAIDQFVDESLSEAVGDVKSLCKMRNLAEIFKARRLEIETRDDGSAKFVKTEEGKHPLYDEINESELAFHWKSFALQHACSETFRKDGDVIAESIKERIGIMRDNRDDEGSDSWFQELAMVIRDSCGKAKTCKAANKLISGSAKKSELWPEGWTKAT